MGRWLISSLGLRVLLALTLAAAPIASSAAEFIGRVVGVLDGDTVDVVTADKQQIRVRLSGIDAPEKSQPFSQAAKRALSDLVFDRQVSVIGSKTDRYGRFVGRVLVAGIDANLQMIAAGLAWHFKRYEHEQEPTERVTYARAETEARAKSLGLWREASPLAPWDYRASRRSAEGPTPATRAPTTDVAPIAVPRKRS